MAKRHTEGPGERLPPDKTELAEVVRRAFDEPDGADYRARISNAVRAVMQARTK